jgi:hypothetical protein
VIQNKFSRTIHSHIENQLTSHFNKFVTIRIPKIIGLLVPPTIRKIGGTGGWGKA